MKSNMLVRSAFAVAIAMSWIGRANAVTVDATHSVEVSYDFTGFTDFPAHMDSIVQGSTSSVGLYIISAFDSSANLVGTRKAVTLAA